MIRYAVYFAPPVDSALHAFGSSWLGRDARTGALLAAPNIDGLSPERVAAITAAPRLYGFHATLKPPFALAAGRTADELVSTFEAFARARAAFPLPALQLAEIGGFLAFVPSAPSVELTALADRAVRDFDVFRAPPSSDELVRRAHASLDPRERELLDLWGYPYVLDRWRFHMTLTQRLDAHERTVVRHALEPVVEPLCRERLPIAAIALFVQPEADAPFTIKSFFRFGHAA